MARPDRRGGEAPAERRRRRARHRRGRCALVGERWLASARNDPFARFGGRTIHRPSCRQLRNTHSGAMELKFALLADYATADAAGKLTIVGVFGVVNDVVRVTPIPLPQFWIVAVFNAHVAEGTEHEV